MATHFFGADFFGGEFFFGAIPIIVIDTHDDIDRWKKRIDDRERLRNQIKSAYGEDIREALKEYIEPDEKEFRLKINSDEIEPISALVENVVKRRIKRVATTYSAPYDEDEDLLWLI